MCTYNGEKFIEDQLQSILLQSHQPDEIVICDDCSQDSTVKKARTILSQWSGIVKLIVNDHNLGYKLNFQKAINLCKGDIIFLSDQDDVWNLKKIEMMSNVLIEHINVKLVFHDAELVDEHLKPISSSFWNILNFKETDFLDKQYNRLLCGNVVQGSACAFRSEIFAKAYPFPAEAIHDEWLALVAALYGEIVSLSNPLMKYRQGHNQIGGEVRSANQGIQLWLDNSLVSVRNHILQLINRRVVLRTLVQRYSDQMDPDFQQGLDQNIKFLSHRLHYILGNSILINWGEYFRYCIGKRQAIRQCFKDTFAKIYCVKYANKEVIKKLLK